MNIKVKCLSHTPLRGLNDAGGDVEQEVDAILASARAEASCPAESVTCVLSMPTCHTGRGSTMTSPLPASTVPRCAAWRCRERVSPSVRSGASKDVRHWACHACPLPPSTSCSCAVSSYVHGSAVPRSQLQCRVAVARLSSCGSTATVATETWGVTSPRPVNAVVRVEASAAASGEPAASATPRQRTHARFEFVEREGLGHVVVCAEVEALDAFVDAVGRGQDQHGQVRIARAQPPQHFEAGHFRQAQIEDEEIESLHRQRGIGFRARLHMVNGVCRLAE